MTVPLMQKIAFIWYGLLSTLLFFLYGLDKAQAVAAGRRIPERVLHSMALAGGFPGGLLGRMFFHHKTRKPYFLILLLGSAAIHGILWFMVLKNGNFTNPTIYTSKFRQVVMLNLKIYYSMDEIQV